MEKTRQEIDKLIIRIVLREMANGKEYTEIKNSLFDYLRDEAPSLLNFWLNAHSDDVIIKGINYKIIKREFVEDINTTRPNTAKEMTKNGWVAEYTIKRPRGKKIGTCLLHKTGAFGLPVFC